MILRETVYCLTPNESVKLLQMPIIRKTIRYIQLSTLTAIGQDCPFDFIFITFYLLLNR